MIIFAIDYKLTLALLNLTIVSVVIQMVIIIVNGYI